ncbi:MAG: hypothetical protein J2P25_15745 [Nocardiopsaceae bacterium]|nr:hypothetical protein [Nocardiopsaceae bacterium]
MIKHRAMSAALATAFAAATLASGGTAEADSATGRCAPPPDAAWQTTSRETSYQHGSFILDSNEWNQPGGYGTPASWMTTWAGHDSSWGVCANEPGTGYPYPEERMPLGNTPMSSLSSVTSGYDETTPADGQWDSAYDIWLKPPSSAPGQSPTELMIWTANHGEQTGNQANLGTANIGGHQYQVSACDSCNRVSFVFPSDVPTTTVNLLAVLRYAAQNPAINPITGKDPVVTEIDRGWEIHKTDGTEAFTTNHYWLSVLHKARLLRKRKPHHTGPR